MTLLTPWSAFWLLIATVPVLLVLYILRLRRARQVVPSTIMWIESTEDLQANTPFQRLRRNILLLLQLIALLLLALAVAQGRIESPEGRGGSTALLIDRSASMQATDGSGGPSRFEHAVSAAHEAVDRLHPDGWFGSGGGRTMIIGLSGGSEVVQPFTTSASRLHAAIDQLTVLDTSASLRGGLDLARASSIEPDPEKTTPAGDAVRVELFTDGGLIDLADTTDRSEDVRVHLVGQEVDNVSVLAVSAQRLPTDPDMVQVFASIGNWGSSETTVTIQLSVNGTAVAIEDLTIGAATDTSGVPSRRDVVFTPRLQPGDTLFEVRLLHSDAFELDDAGWSLSQAATPLAVLVVSDRPLMSRAIGVLPGTKVHEAASLPTDATQIEQFDLIVMDQVDVAALPSAPTLSIDTRLPSSHLTWLGRGRDTTLLTTDLRHEAMDSMPADMWVAQPQSVQAAGTVRVLAEGLYGPLVMAWDEADARRLHYAFDPAQSTWPWDPSFITTLMNSVDWLTRRDAGGIAAGVATGEMASVVLPASAQDVTVYQPDGTPLAVSQVRGGTLTFGPVNRHGPWLARWGGPQGDHAMVVVSADVEAEGDLRVPEKLRIGSSGTALAAAPQRGSTPMWPWAVGGALVILLIEWAIYCRRIS